MVLLAGARVQIAYLVEASDRRIQKKKVRAEILITAVGRRGVTRQQIPRPGVLYQFLERDRYTSVLKNLRIPGADYYCGSPLNTAVGVCSGRCRYSPDYFRQTICM